MDCGPASLKCLLEGFGIRASYGRLREACQTDVDGTSIDTVEEIAIQLGLDAKQIIVPLEHVLLRGHHVLPAIVVVRHPNNLTHFLVVWRRHGRFVQVMDPAIGRRWMTSRRFLQTLYVHDMGVPASQWREWAGRETTLSAFVRRLTLDGVSRRVSDQVVARAQADSGWRSLAAVDAAARMTHALVGAKGVRRGREATRLFERVFTRTVEQGDASNVVIPPSYWTVRPGQADASVAGGEFVRVRGAVLCTVRSRRPEAVTSRTASVPSRPPPDRLSPELTAALSEPSDKPGRILFGLLRADGALAPGVLITGALLAAGSVIVEALLFRGVLDGGSRLNLSGQRAGAVLALVAFVLLLLLLEFPIASIARRIGRRLETRLRMAFLRKIPRLGDRYFQSRPASDMAERGHSIHHIRQLPVLGAQFARSLFELLFTASAIIWIEPRSVVLVLIATCAALALPFIAQPVLRERDLRVRTHAGALGRFYLDALLGLMAVRTHAAERTLRREHEGLLVEWARASLGLQRIAVTVDAIQLVTGFGFAAWLLLETVGRGDGPGTALLIAYWVLNLPVLGRELAQLAWQYPVHRNLAQRLVEPLGALEDVSADREPIVAESSPQSRAAPPPHIAFDAVTVRVAGHTILEDITLSIPGGSHVAIVGASGAGKSSLLGLLLGWHRVSSGCLAIDDEPLDGARVDRLRTETAWVDPAVHLWNRTLLHNLEYGVPRTARQSMAAAIEMADLYQLLQRLPDGMQTPLGEGGGLISGGEGQRVRFGRAMMRDAARLVLLDEPFHGLERQRRHDLLERARRLWKKATLLCVTHDITETLTFDRVLVVHEGRIVEDGDPRVLAEEAGSRYAAMMRAEENVRERLWRSKRWRRLTLDHGRLTEEAREGTA
jgi:ABC-type bacteriocin/lantibiotic exporter with double-glycine peptidase domain